MTMKKILYILATVLCITAPVSCQKTGEEGTDISGEWHLVDTGGLIDGQQLDIQVYVHFNNGSFELFQRLGENQTRWWVYSGTYSTSDNVLSGRYSDGTRLGGTSGEGYAISLEGGTLTLTSVFSGEVSIYESAEIPDEVRENAVAPVRSAETAAPVPLL